MRTRLTEMLGCRYPIIQTAMGWVADAKLVAATTNAGGFGFLAGAVMTADEVERGILEIKALTDGPFGVNFHMYVAQAPAIVDLCIKYGVRAVSYSRSPVPALIEKLKAAQIICIPTVGAAKHAVKAVSLRADALVVQGSEGGGHTGAVASSILLPDVLSQVSVPVVAAGGYRDGRGLVAALALGAEGIAMGTRFLMTQESPVPEPTKARYVNAVPEQIQVSTKLDGMPQRMIDNPCLDRLNQTSALGMWVLAVKNGLAFSKETQSSLLSSLKSAWAISRSGDLNWAQTLMAANAPMMIQEAMVNGHPDQGILPSGQVAGIISDLPTVDALIASIVADAEKSIAALSVLTSQAANQQKQD